MAHAKICDRCGNVYGKNDYHAYFDDNKRGIVKGVCVMFKETDRLSGPLVNDAETRKNAYFDLCDNCADMLNLFLQDKNSKVSTQELGI